MFFPPAGNDKRLGVMTDEEWEAWTSENERRWQENQATRRRLRERIATMALMHAVADAVAALFGGTDER